VKFRCGSSFFFGNQKSIMLKQIHGVLKQEKILHIHGSDTVKFLQGIFTNDLHKLQSNGDVLYGAFLTHKGRILADAQIVQEEV